MKIFIPMVFLLVLLGCREGRGFFEFNAIVGSHYPGAEVRGEGSILQNDTIHAWFGPYRLRGYTWQRKMIEFYEQGPLPDSQINAWWQVHYKDKADKFFYARSLSDQGIQADTMHFWSDWKYFAYISFGPMYINTLALNDRQKDSEHLNLLEVSKWSGMHYYAWGKESSLYYKVQKVRVNPLREVIENWIEVPGIAISKKQFLLLNTRCGKPWLKTRCFMDESFPDLTPEQLAYIKAHEHEEDEYWLSDDAEPPEVKEKVNPWL